MHLPMNLRAAVCLDVPAQRVSARRGHLYPQARSNSVEVKWLESGARLFQLNDPGHVTYPVSVSSLVKMKIAICSEDWYDD